MAINVKKCGPWGSPYPPNWNIELDPSETIKEFIIRFGFIVDGIEFVVTDSEGKTTTAKIGGGGGASDKIQLLSNERITEISGQYALYEYGEGKYVASIKIHTNLRPGGYGPYGAVTKCKDIRTFSVPIPSNCAIAGFFGRGTKYLECFGVYVRRVD